MCDSLFQGGQTALVGNTEVLTRRTAVRVCAMPTVLVVGGRFRPRQGRAVCDLAGGKTNSARWKECGVDRFTGLVEQG